ncbi:MAG TPA: membrane protein insertion efficiency factor YidD [Patescibacteria group bacterium]|nr:membrane protein insertion efficiency factor YidD [Patescibacteria group bacterium]
MKILLIYLIKTYKAVVSPVFEALFGKACRFTPTCSQYTIEALDRFGVSKGLSLGITRFSKCHPWGGSGYDPIPNK